MSRYSANTIEDMRRLLLAYRDNMRVEVEHGTPVTAKTVADLRAVTSWPDGLVLDIHIDLDPRLSVVRVGAGHPVIYPCPSAASQMNADARRQSVRPAGAASTTT